MIDVKNKLADLLKKKEIKNVEILNQLDRLSNSQNGLPVPCLDTANPDAFDFSVYLIYLACLMHGGSNQGAGLTDTTVPLYVFSCHLKLYLESFQKTQKTEDDIKGFVNKIGKYETKNEEITKRKKELMDALSTVMPAEDNKITEFFQSEKCRTGRPV